MEVLQQNYRKSIITLLSCTGNSLYSWPFMTAFGVTLHFEWKFFIRLSVPFNARIGYCSGRYISGHNSPAAGVRELVKPSTDSGGRFFYFRFKIAFKFWVCVFFVGDVISKVVFAFFGWRYRHWVTTQWAIFWRKCFGKLGYDPSP